MTIRTVTFLKLGLVATLLTPILLKGQDSSGQAEDEAAIRKLAPSTDGQKITASISSHMLMTTPLSCNRRSGAWRESYFPMSTRRVPSKTLRRPNLLALVQSSGVSPDS